MKQFYLFPLGMIFSTLLIAGTYFTLKAINHKPVVVAPSPQLPLYEIEQKCRAQVRKEAAEAGVAYYELNQKTGEVEFHYVDIQRVIQQVAQQMQQRMQQVSPLQ